MRNRILRILIPLLAMLMILPVLTGTAYAAPDGDGEPVSGMGEVFVNGSDGVYINGDLPEAIPDNPPEPILEPGVEITLDLMPDDIPDEMPSFSPVPLTPPGNMNIVDDISGAQAEDKQFITVVTKSGAYFYIIIDRAGNRENVHFLNLVDESDLLAILEGGNTQTTRQLAAEPVMAAPLPAAEPESDVEPEQSNTGGLIILVVLLAAAGGVVYYLKAVKPKKPSKIGPDLDEFDFDADFFSGGLANPGGTEQISAAGHKEPEKEEHGVSWATDIDTPDDEYRDEYTHGSYFTNTETTESEDET